MFWNIPMLESKLMSLDISSDTLYMHIEPCVGTVKQIKEYIWKTLATRNDHLKVQVFQIQIITKQQLLAE